MRIQINSLYTLPSLVSFVGVSTDDDDDDDGHDDQVDQDVLFCIRTCHVCPYSFLFARPAVFLFLHSFASPKQQRQRIHPPLPLGARSHVVLTSPCTSLLLCRVYELVIDSQQQHLGAHGQRPRIGRRAARQCCREVASRRVPPPYERR